MGRTVVVFCMLAATRSVTAAPCSDDDPGCGPWAGAGECSKNPAYMLVSCRKSCNVCDHLAPKAELTREQWELEDLTRPYAESAITDLDGSGLAAFANSSELPVFTWFYAPWCKQCKIVRPSVEAAAQRFTEPSGRSMAFAKLDCVADVEAKKYYGVTACGCRHGHRHCCYSQASLVLPLARCKVRRPRLREAVPRRAPQHQHRSPPW